MYHLPAVAILSLVAILLAFLVAGIARSAPVQRHIAPRVRTLVASLVARVRTLVASLVAHPGRER